jgi:Fe-S-cluster containining protein
MGYSDFIETHCRWIPIGNGLEQLSLKEKSNYDCIFWKDGCTVYEGRPLQCRSFPFWESIVASPATWEAAKADCPGMGKGALHDAREIENWLALRKADPIVQRRHP